MKNILLVSFVALLGIAGGAYTFLTPEKINSFAEYLPESIAALITTGTVQDLDESVEQDQIQAVENISAFKTNQVEEEIIEVEAVENIQTSNSSQPIQDQVSTEIKKVEMPDEKPVANIENKQVTIDKVVSLASQTTTKKEKPSIEVLELESQIKNIEKSIGQLDGENTALEERFQKILKENRALALKLKKIDEQIKVSSE